MRASEDPQDKSQVSLVESFTAAAYHQPRDTLRHARGALAHADALGISHEFLRWTWPLAARAAHDLRDDGTVGELLTLLDSYQPGHLAPMLRAERNLVRARLAARDGETAARTAFAAAVGSLRELSTPYHLAHGLLDYTQYLLHRGDDEAAAAAIEEVRGIADRLRCQPLLDRAADLVPAGSRTRA